jgi:hypothetical protein
LVSLPPPSGRDETPASAACEIQFRFIASQVSQTRQIYYVQP